MEGYSRQRDSMPGKAQRCSGFHGTKTADNPASREMLHCFKTIGGSR